MKTRWKDTLGLMGFSLLKIPLIFICGVKILKLTDEACEIKIPLMHWTRNHIRSMYFGALAVGADCAGGLMAMQPIKKSGRKVVLVFKDFHADFLKRAESDVHFSCTDGLKLKKLVDEAIKTKQRVETPFTVIATTPKKTGDEPVAKFKLTISLKLKE